VSEDRFNERLAAVRQRFASALAGKITDTYAAIPNLTGDKAGAVEAVAETYRRVHGICGVGPSVGFVMTGDAARNVEAILLPPFRAKRGLNAEEVARLERTLGALWDAARAELQTTLKNRG
jgi:hypothetical protein